MEPLADKWTAFGFRVFECNGHDVKDLRQVFRDAAATPATATRGHLPHRPRARAFPPPRTIPIGTKSPDLKRPSSRSSAARLEAEEKLSDAQS